MQEKARESRSKIKHEKVGVSKKSKRRPQKAREIKRKQEKAREGKRK
jgi:hypothetical protein